MKPKKTKPEKTKSAIKPESNVKNESKVSDESNLQKPAINCNFKRFDSKVFFKFGSFFRQRKNTTFRSQSKPSLVS